MAITVIETSSSLTLTGWSESVIISKDAINAVLAGHENDDVLLVGSKFSLTKTHFFRHQSGSDFTYPATFISYATSNGADTYGSYLELALTFDVKRTTDGVSSPCVIRFRFYAGKTTFEAVIIQHETLWITTECRMDYKNTQSRWFTTALPYFFGWEANVGTQDMYGDWSETFPSDTNIFYPLDVINWPQFPPDWGGWNTSGMYGTPVYGTDEGSIGAYIALSEDILYEKTWRVNPQPTYLVVLADVPKQSFWMSTAKGYRALKEYGTWQNRDYSLNVPAWAVGTCKISVANNQPPDLTGYTPMEEMNGGGSLSRYAGYAKELQVLAANNWYDIPVKSYEFDFKPYEFSGPYYPRLAKTIVGGAYDGQYDPGLGCTLKDLADLAISYGMVPGFYMVPAVGDPSAYPADVVYPGSTIWNPFTANGKAAIKSIVDTVVGAGFKFCRWDGPRNSPFLEFAILKVFRDHAKSLDPGFVIETTSAYNTPLADVIRTNDWFLYNTGWDTAFKRRAKVMYCVSGQNVVDCDFLGNNGVAGHSRPLETVVKQSRLQFAFGRPIIGFTSTTEMKNAWADTRLKSYFAAYNALPQEVPKREIIGDWETSFSTKSTYSDGSTVIYDAVADTITFAIVPPSVASSLSNLRLKVGDNLLECIKPYYKPAGETVLYEVSKLYQKVGEVLLEV